MISTHIVIRANIQPGRALLSREHRRKTMPTSVAATPAAPSILAREHFAAQFAFETDCWDVHDALTNGPDFVLLDVRSPTMFAAGHIPGAINLPHGKITRTKMEAYPAGTLFITYCAGPPCNGAARGALR